MYFSYLIAASRAHFKQYPDALSYNYSVKFFHEGGEWMKDRMSELNSITHKSSSTVQYIYYGWFKYGISAILFAVMGMWFYSIHPGLLPISIIGFYVVEVHFLFLFPLLINGDQQPVINSIKKTYQVGLLKAIFTIIPIAVYMLVGLLKKQPLLNWHTGCMSILIWYNNETGNW